MCSPGAHGGICRCRYDPLARGVAGVGDVGGGLAFRAAGAARMSGRSERRLLWISLTWATFGLDVVDGLVTEAAPIARWCKGKTAAYCIAYWRQRGATVEWVEL
jgi:hypothetical protein